ncbi:MAG TPA: type II/IV secretion system ATPase subunit [Candidatus Nanoarchaeia archaeon]|nr:type II/IV secretion system ATPase subunit [Candidatus Nanoarchaeia archaeon]
MAVVDTYGYNSGNIPVSVSIETDKAEFVMLYKITISQISATTEIILEKIRNELVDKVKLEIGDVTDTKKFDTLKMRFQKTIITLIKKYLPDLSEETLDFFTTYLMHKSFGLGRIELLMSDTNLEEVVVNNAEEPVWVYHHKHGWLKTNIDLDNEELIKHYSTVIARRVGRSITLLSPLLDAHLEGGDRVNATLQPISTKGNTITIRKFAAKPITITNFILNRAISVNAAALVWLAMEYEMSALVSGGTASGKTSFLGALCSFFPPNQRIISVEDTREVQLPKYLHWIPMNTREANVEGKGGVEMLDLIVNTLRMRPDRIVVGEIRRKKEAETLFEAMHTGHSVYATVHANNAEETINRLTNPPIEIPKSLLPAVSLIVNMYRNRRTGVRRIFQVAEITEDSRANVLLQLDLKQDKLVNANPSQKLIPDLQTQTGLTQQEIDKILEEKGTILKWLAKNNIDSVDGIGKVVATYYTNKDSLLTYLKNA